MKTADDDNRVLTLKPTGTIVGKLTVKKEQYNDIPLELINPTWKDIIEVING